MRRHHDTIADPAGVRVTGGGAIERAERYHDTLGDLIGSRRAPWRDPSTARDATEDSLIAAGVGTALAVRVAALIEDRPSVARQLDAERLRLGQLARDFREAGDDERAGCVARSLAVVAKALDAVRAAG